MPPWVHRMVEVDPDTMTGVCANCGPVPLKRKVNSRSHAGKVRYACKIGEDRHANQGKYRRRLKYRQHRKESCERCGFVPVDPCQLDVHHRDGDRENCDYGNLETVCANCHRLDSLGPRSASRIARELRDAA